MEIVPFGPERIVALTLITLEMVQNHISDAKPAQITNRLNNLVKYNKFRSTQSFFKNTTGASDFTL